MAHDWWAGVPRLHTLPSHVTPKPLPPAVRTPPAAVEGQSRKQGDRPAKTLSVNTWTDALKASAAVPHPRRPRPPPPRRQRLMARPPSAPAPPQCWWTAAASAAPFPVARGGGVRVRLTTQTGAEATLAPAINGRQAAVQLRGGGQMIAAVRGRP